MLRRSRLALALAGFATLLPGALLANPSAFDKTTAGPGPDDDVTGSIGVFRIVVEPPYRAWFDANIGTGPFWDGVSRLTSPVLYDFTTTIGRSAAHQQGSAPDVIGTPVGTAGTPVKDADMIFPPGFNSPNPLRYEVHTEVRSMNLQSSRSLCDIQTVCTGAPFPVSVRAGTGLGLQLCPGEIESNSNDGFPAKSFFDVFVEVNLGGPLGFDIVKNDALDPMIVVHDPISGFPPQVVYIHENLTAVPVYFKNSGTTGAAPFTSYTAGQRFGYLVLAGHGAEHSDCDTTVTSCEEFWNDVTSRPEMIVPDPTATLLALFQAEPVEDGLELRWQFGDPSLVRSVDLERAEAKAGPWSLIAADRRDDGGVTVALDRGVNSGQTYYYRIVVLGSDGERTIFGPLSITAGSAFAEFALGRVVPNPSKGRTRIDYTVGRESRVRVSILDVQGRAMAVVAEGMHRPGKYQATWSGQTERGEAPAGLYFVRYETPGKILMERITLTR